MHPDWVYCEYNSASDKFFSTPEERVLHFLARSRRPGWKWMSLRTRSPGSHHKQASKPDKDAYYCEYEFLIIILFIQMCARGLLGYVRKFS